jgi:PAS domain S-box-containing protein
VYQENEVKKLERQMEELSNCFLSFKADPDENINSLVELCGESLRGTCAFYNRLDKGVLRTIGKWNAPADYNIVEKPDGHICHYVIKHGRDDVVVIRNLGKTSYARTDPNVSRYNLRTYVGRAVRFGGSNVGSLCVVYKRDFKLTREDERILEISASAIGAEEKRKQTIVQMRDSEEKYRSISRKLQSLMKSSATMLRTMDMHRRLKTIAEAIREQGWRRVVITLRDENLDTTDIVSAGLTKKDERYLKEHQSPGSVWRKRLSSMFERYRLGEFYYLPWSDPLVQEQFKYALSSKIPKAQTIDWNPDDLLFIPLRLPTGQVVGIISMDDPRDGRRPTRESLAPLELFAHQAAVAVESARLIQQLNEAKSQLEEYTEHLEEKVRDRTLDLKESEEKLRSIFAASPDSIAATDLNGNIIECNEQTVKMHGYSSKEELIGRNALELIAGRDHQKALEGMKKTFEQGYLKNAEYTLLTKDGREFPGELSATLIRDALGKGIGFVAITSDITARKAMEQQLFKSERLAAIGELSAMIGHDLRNPLTGIMGAAYYLKSKFGKKMDVKAREMLEVIEKDIQYSNKIISDLLEYSREIKLELTETTPKSLIQQALSLVSVPENVRIVNLTHNAPKLMVDVDKLKRTFVNIIRNAYEAMSTGGTLTIRSRKLVDNLEITFSDTGVGMSKQTLESLWKPLFTTKAKGMGFGLPICKRIIEGHGGKISVASEAGKGAVIKIAVPITLKVEQGEKVWVNLPESWLSMTTKA